MNLQSAQQALSGFAQGVQTHWMVSGGVVGLVVLGLVLLWWALHRKRWGVVQAPKAEEPTEEMTHSRWMELAMRDGRSRLTHPPHLEAEKTEEAKASESVRDAAKEERAAHHKSSKGQHGGLNRPVKVVLAAVVLGLLLVGGGAAWLWSQYQVKVQVIPWSHIATTTPTPTETEAQGAIPLTLDHQSSSSAQASASATPTPTATPTPAPTPVDKASVSVTVLNGGAPKGEAGKIGQLLRSDGFTVASVGNADRYTYAQTELHYPTGRTAEAQAVVDAIHASYPTVTQIGIDGASGFTLILGGQ